MNAMIVFEGVAPVGAAIRTGLFTHIRRDEQNVTVASSEARRGFGYRGLVNRRVVSARRSLLLRLRTWLVAACAVCVSFTPRPASAQEVIHASTGTVASVSTGGKSVSIKLDDGSIRSFKEISDSHDASSLEKTVQAKAIPPGGFGKVGEHVVLFYYGVGDLCTAVAYKDVGAAPSNQMSGVVSQFERKQHLLTVVGTASQKEQISVPEQTVVDTPDGVRDGLQFHPGKGEHLEVIWSQANGSPTALFITQS
jgi:hypothetical protein